MFDKSFIVKITSIYTILFKTIVIQNRIKIKPFLKIIKFKLIYIYKKGVEFLIYVVFTPFINKYIVDPETHLRESGSDDWVKYTMRVSNDIVGYSSKKDAILYADSRIKSLAQFM